MTFKKSIECCYQQSRQVSIKMTKSQLLLTAEINKMQQFQIIRDKAAHFIFVKNPENICKWSFIIEE
jgi:hypothetical protein